MRSLVLLLIAMSLLTVCKFANAQCADSWETMTFQCANGDGCSGQITVYIPEGDEYGFYPKCYGADCCGQLFSTCYAYGTCEPDGLKTPEFRKALLQVASVSDVLIADCQGNFVPYMRSPENSRELANKLGGKRPSIDEHVLR